MTVRLLRLNVRCRKCGRGPPIRITPREKELHDDDPPDRVVKTVECRCGETYLVTAAAYQGAA